MKITRKNCFETNSSSCHSITLTEYPFESNGYSKVWDDILQNLTKDLEELEVMEDNENDTFKILLPLKLSGKYYGWEFELISDPIEKLNYVFTQFSSTRNYRGFVTSDSWKEFKSIFRTHKFFSFKGLKRFDIPDYANIEIVFEFSIDKEKFKNAVIDNESLGVLCDLNEEQLRKLVFDPRNVIIIDGDG